MLIRSDKQEVVSMLEVLAGHVLQKVEDETYKDLCIFCIYKIFRGPEIRSVLVCPLQNVR